MKPLSELHKDTEACRKILQSIRWGDFEKVSRQNKSTYIYGIHPEGKGICLIILDSGNIFFEYDGTDDDFGSAFDLIDLIRSLGYDPNGSREDSEEIKGRLR